MIAPSGGTLPRENVLCQALTPISYGVQAAARAIEIGFGKRPVFIREGGSIPIVTLFKDLLGYRNILLLGWGSPDDGVHSPNERFSLDDFLRGIRSAAALLYELPAALGS